MSPLRRRLRAASLAPVVTGLLMLAAACGGPDPEDAAPKTPTPPATATAAPTPPVAGCYDLSYDAALAATTSAPAVDCTQPHTSVTFHVGQADTVTPDGHLLAIDSTRVRTQMATVCPRQFATYVGGTAEQRRLSMLAPVWFGPTLKQSDQGQSWLRCDVIALASTGTLAPLEPTLAGVLGRADGRKRWGRCATARPGTPDAQQVICSAPHAWRAVATIDVPAAAAGAMPGPKRLEKTGALCQERVGDRAKDPLSFTWGWTPPTEAQWQAGARYGFCWAPGKQ